MLCCCGQPACAQDFTLENPVDPNASSLATIVGADLVITDAGGQQFIYQRRPGLDTPNGQFQGFYCASAGRYLRWPVSGMGNMHVGRLAGGVVVWNPSQMQIKGAPGGGPADPGSLIPGGPLHIATLPLGPNSICVARIDPTGQLHFFIGHGERWRYVPGQHPPGSLIPGAPLQLVAHAGAIVPKVYTIGPKGRFLEVTGGQVIAELPGPPGVKFVPGGQFAVIQSASTNWLFSADRQGRLWRIELVLGETMIEGHLGVLEPGLPITPMLDGRELFLTDRHGTIVVYSLDPLGVWHGPEVVAPGFHSGGFVTAWTRPGTTAMELAAVDQQGRLQVLRQMGGVWHKNTLPGIKLSAGSPVTAFESALGLSLTAVLADGRWMEFFETAGHWENRVIAAGFPPRAPLVFNKFGPMLFATDITERLVSAIWTGIEWQSVIVVPADFRTGEMVMVPRLVSRRTILNRAIEPVKLDLLNPTTEELVIRIHDARIAEIQEIAIPPGGKSTLRADRDAGGTLEEVYLVPTPNGPVQKVRQLPLPPRQFYDLVVYANRVTYQYIDRRKQKGPVADFNDTSLVSLGTIPLPPGPLLRDGTRLDVYQMATAARQPGTAAILDPLGPSK